MDLTAVWHAATTVALGLLVGSASTSASEDSLQTFVATYRCEVVERLSMIRANRSTTDRFLVLSLDGVQRGYVQCLFLDDARLLCEAESGYYADRPGEPRSFRVPPAALAALARLGFATEETEGNYQRLIEIATPADLEYAAEVMLSALYEGYGARTYSSIDWDAPLGEGAGIVLRCMPLS